MTQDSVLIVEASLFNRTDKLYERIIEKRARTTMEPKLGEKQLGYRKDRRTSDLIFILRMIMTTAGSSIKICNVLL